METGGRAGEATQELSDDAKVTSAGDRRCTCSPCRSPDNMIPIIMSSVPAFILPWASVTLFLRRSSQAILFRQI